MSGNRNKQTPVYGRNLLNIWDTLGLGPKTGQLQK